MRIIKESSVEDLSCVLKVDQVDSLIKSNQLFEKIIELISDNISQKFLEKYGNEILASIDKEDVKNICKVNIAKKVYEEMAKLNAEAAPFSRSLPEINKTFKEKIKSIFNA